MHNLITLYKPLSYEEKEQWYYRITSLSEVQRLGGTFEIDNSNTDYYGICYDNGLIGINLSQIANLTQLFNTIAHELAHLKEFNHSRRHKQLTADIEKYIKQVISEQTVYFDKIKRNPVRAFKNTTSYSSNSYSQGNSSSLDNIYNKLARMG